MRTATLLLALLAAAGTSDAFVQLMGSSDAYCDSEGSYCLSDSGCCQDLECVVGQSNLQGMGGICRRRSSNTGSSSSSASSNYPPMDFGPMYRSCSLDSDCPAGQCCNRRPTGFRGSLVSTCETDCGYREVGDILGDYYSRFYRRATRGRHGGKTHHRGGERKSEHQKHQQHHEDQKENKNKKKKSDN